MKFTICILSLIFCYAVKNGLPNHTFQSKQNKAESIITENIHALPEVKEWFIKAKKSKPSVIVNAPNSQSKYYSAQVGISNHDQFRTSYWLYIDPKTYEIFYWDQLDSANGKITLKQWRYWRTKPGWNLPHYYKGQKLIVLRSR